MREEEFRRQLSARLGEGSVRSYLAYCRRVERDLAVDLDDCDLSKVGISVLADRLLATGAAAKSVSNCRSALEAYAPLIGRAEAAGPVEARPKRRMEITAEQRAAWAASAATSDFNIWLAERVRGPDGQFDLERLYAVAAEYGLEVGDEYRGLNPGQQRMNLGNRLRRVVPASAYGYSRSVVEPEAIEPGDAGGVDAESQSGEKQPAGPSMISANASLASPMATDGGELARLSTTQLLRQYGGILDELRVRGVIRTGNSPVGDYAELLFARAFGWKLAANSSAGHDAMDAEGRRYQIKGRRLSSLAASRQLSAIRRLHEQTFDSLAAVLFDPTFKVTRAALIPHAVVAARARRADHTNSWTFMLDDKVWREPGVADVTAEVAVAAARTNPHSGFPGLKGAESIRSGFADSERDDGSAEAL